jgi:hypothetical protein
MMGVSGKSSSMAGQSMYRYECGGDGLLFATLILGNYSSVAAGGNASMCRRLAPFLPQQQGWGMSHKHRHMLDAPLYHQKPS